MARSCGESGGARRLEAALAAVAERLLAARSAAGGWRGELSESALSTATASLALRVSERGSAEDNGAGGRKDLAAAGLDWLAAHPNADGGWGDTARSLSNISTTLLSWAALSVEPDGPGRRQAIERAETWIRTRTGSLEPEALARAVLDVYGKDRTFSVPILTHCALAGRLGAGRDAWRHVLQLPFELAALPRSWFRFLGLPVVSYALPALIAMGQARHHHLPAGNPAARLVRSLVRERT
jgi:squalene-hopene/tetraprenyl-beta-curcumene cyclase